MCRFRCIHKKTHHYIYIPLSIDTPKEKVLCIIRQKYKEKRRERESGDMAEKKRDIKGKDENKNLAIHNAI